ncbi:MAG: ferrous iron transport protein B [Thermodesulfobacteriota bacterium]
MEPNAITIALAGNPNSGKTTIFNMLTGTRQKVGNWPGVTVEKKEGRIRKYGYDLNIVDLPGTYSLTPFSIEEIVARDYILEEKPDVVIDIIDASNLERSLYLATQLRELDCSKVLFALNMHDLARSRGIKIDADKLSELLNVPVVFTVGNKNEGMDTLLKAAIELAEQEKTSQQKRRVQYNKDIEEAVGALQRQIRDLGCASLGYDLRWTAIKLLEDDTILKKRLVEKMPEQAPVILDAAGIQRTTLTRRLDEEPEIIMTDERYGFIAGIVKEVLTTSRSQRIDISRNIDMVLTNRFLGFPIFILLIWLMFQLTFTIGAYPMEWIEEAVSVFSGLLSSHLPDGILKELILDGIVAGVGSVIVFLPNILILFFCIALFEDTGYMARAAFLMDRIMHLIGLHGKSFIPMLMGFGCNVPAIMASRTLESEKDRILTILITPFMSCSARLPIYIVLAGTFFSRRAGSVLFGIYMAGIIVAIVSGRLFRSTLLKGADAPFVMELPPYRMPMAKNLLIHMWDRSKLFLKKMGGIILVGSVVVWALSAFPRQVDFSIDYAAAKRQLETEFSRRLESVSIADRPGLLQEQKNRLARLDTLRQMEKSEKSWMGSIGKAIAPVFAPLGIDWRGGVALLTGFVAKEIVVSTMGVLYAAENEAEALQQSLAVSGMTPLGALAMMLFVLLYVPCLATITAIYRETAGLKWTLFSIAYSTLIAWTAAFLVYQGGRLCGFA